MKSLLNFKSIIQMLAKLKAQTPEYPADLMAARKAAFQKQNASVNLDGNGKGGGSEQGGGGSGNGGSGALGGGTAVQGFFFQAVD